VVIEPIKEKFDMHPGIKIVIKVLEQSQQAYTITTGWNYLDYNIIFESLYTAFCSLQILVRV
jgi:hypothetical protein